MTSRLGDIDTALLPLIHIRGNHNSDRILRGLKRVLAITFDIRDDGNVWLPQFAAVGTVEKQIQQLLNETAPSNTADALDEQLTSGQNIRIEQLCDSLHFGGMTGDNAANIQKAITDGGWPKVSCVGHTLSLSLHDILDKPLYFGAISKVRNLVTRFRVEHLLGDELIKVQRAAKGPVRSLSLDVVTRFNSICIMLQRFVAEEENVRKAMLNQDCSVEDFLSETELQAVKDMIKVCHHF